MSRSLVKYTLLILSIGVLYTIRLGFTLTWTSDEAMLFNNDAPPLSGHAAGDGGGRPAQLRYDWTSLELTSPLAQQMEEHMKDCSKPLANFRYRNRYGLGSDLHVWTQALCNGMTEGYRIRTEDPWIYVDQATCNNNTSLLSPMLCYFASSELRCPNDNISSIDHALYRGNGNVGRYCQEIAQDDYSKVRAAGIEYLFSRVSPVVIQEAQRQLARVFPPSGVVPRDLIVVQIRWGDKKKEMKLVPIEAYIDAVKQLAASKKTVSVFLSTEDPEAVREFRKHAPEEWRIYVDNYFEELVSYRDSSYNGNPKMTKTLQGKPGLIALGSLLVAMEANDFVLTTASNWSRLMNELRKNVLHPRCNCTRMIDLRPGEW